MTISKKKLPLPLGLTSFLFLQLRLHTPSTKNAEPCYKPAYGLSGCMCLFDNTLNNVRSRTPVCHSSGVPVKGYNHYLTIRAHFSICPFSSRDCTVHRLTLKNNDCAFRTLSEWNVQMARCGSVSRVQFPFQWHSIATSVYL